MDFRKHIPTYVTRRIRPESGLPARLAALYGGIAVALVLLVGIGVYSNSATGAQDATEEVAESTDASSASHLLKDQARLSSIKLDDVGIDGENRAEVAAESETEAARIASIIGSAVGQTFVSLDVPCLMQNPELPTGCESVALTNVLLYYGFDLDKTTIADDWLPTSDDDFVYSFLGSPYDPGGNSCMAPCIALTANNYLSAQGSGLTAVDISWSSIEDMLALVDSGHPVIVWASMDLSDMSEPYLVQYENGIEYCLYTSSHCVVVNGYDREQGVVFVCDSISGNIALDIDVFEQSYEHLGSQAVVII